MSLTEIPRWLLTNFAANKEIGNALWGKLFSGGFTGPPSDWYGGLIASIEAWPDEPEAVTSWSSQVLDYLRHQRDAAKLEESERDY
ncbi:MAG: hypothetical protein IH942_08660 [Acidobacteria bacterium]|nr:hypothetical protein [Acidobacteriota bacterium]